MTGTHRVPCDKKGRMTMPRDIAQILFEESGEGLVYVSNISLLTNASIIYPYKVFTSKNKNREIIGEFKDYYLRAPDSQGRIILTDKYFKDKKLNIYGDDDRVIISVSEIRSIKEYFLKKIL